MVVANDDGGGIFTLLEPGEPEQAAAFERVFGTPLGTSLEALCPAPAPVACWRHERPSSAGGRLAGRPGSPSSRCRYRGPRTATCRRACARRPSPRLA